MGKVQKNSLNQGHNVCTSFMSGQTFIYTIASAVWYYNPDIISDHNSVLSILNEFWIWPLTVSQQILNYVVYFELVVTKILCTLEVITHGDRC